MTQPPGDNFTPSPTPPGSAFGAAPPPPPPPPPATPPPAPVPNPATQPPAAPAAAGYYSQQAAYPTQAHPGYPPPQPPQPPQPQPPAGPNLTERLQKGVGDISDRVGDLHGKVDRVIADEPFWVKALRRVGLAALVIGVVGGLIAFIIIMVVDFDVDVFGYTREFGLNAFTKFLIALGAFLGSVTTGALAAAASMVLANIADDLDALRKK